MIRDAEVKSLALNTARPSHGHEIRLLFLADNEEIASPVRDILQKESSEMSVKFVTVAPKILRKDLANVDVILAYISENKTAYLKLLRDVRARRVPVGFIAIAPPQANQLLAEYLEAGADDYISIPDLTRLPLSIRNVFEKIDASRTLTRIRESREDSSDTVDTARTGLLLIDTADKAILGTNAVFSRMYQEASGGLSLPFPFPRPATPIHRNNFFKRLSKIQADSRKPSQVRLELPSESGLNLQMAGTAVRMEGSSGSPIMILVDDVAEVAESNNVSVADELALSRKFNEVSEPVNAITECALFTLDLQGRVTLWNDNAKRLTGYERSEVLGRPFATIISSNDRREGLPQQSLNEALQDGRSEGELEILPKNDGPLWVRVVMTLLLSEKDEPVGFIVLAKKLDEYGRWQRVLAKRESELHGLAEHLESEHESDRTMIARKLHDEFGQMLTALRLDVTILNRMISKSVDSVKRIPLLEKLSVTSQLIESMIMSTRKIITELRPAVLDELGLPTAILWQAQEFEDRTGIHCKIDDLQHAVALTEKQSTAIFRIFQETLANVARHSKATNVSVSAVVADDCYVLQVADDGIGIDLKNISTDGSYGLLDIRERIAVLSGEFEILSELGKGTTLIIKIPYTGG